MSESNDININYLLEQAHKMKASDIHITVGCKPAIRVNSVMKMLENEDIITPDKSLKLAKSSMSDVFWDRLESIGEVDFSFSRPGLGRYRVNAYKQRGTYAMAIRLQPFSIPKFEDLGLPSSLKSFADKQKGLVLVTGTTGSGKSTTLASLINEINEHRQCHIITIEDPIEYLHRHNKSIVNQREVGIDTHSFAAALRATLREDPDVILVGEMRDAETISIALTAAETGHLVFSTLHTVGAAKTIDRIVDAFPPNHQQQINVNLRLFLRGWFLKH